MVYLLPWGFPAEAGVPISLPSGQRQADWDEVLRLGDLDWATVDAGVVVTAEGPTWTVRVRDPDGEVRQATIAAPVGADDREDLVWLVVSLLTPVSSPGPAADALEHDPEPVAAIAPSPPPRPRPVPRPGPVSLVPLPLAPPLLEPEPEPEPPPEPEPEPVVAAVELPAPPPRPAPMVPSPAPPDPPREPRPPPPEDPGIRPWARVGSGVGFRPGIPASWAGWLTVGLARDLVGVGIGAGIGTRTPLRPAGEARAYAAIPVMVEGLLDGRHVIADVAVGAEHRRFFDGDRVVHAGLMPFVRAEGAASLSVASRVHLEAGLAYRRDLGATDILRDGERVLLLPASTFQIGFGLRYR